MNYEMLYLLLRRSHIAVGLLGVVAFWIPVFAKKGGRAHVIAGRIFEWSLYYVASTALFTCARYLLTPHDFAFMDRPGISAEELARIQFVQFFLLMLAFLAWIVLGEMRTGMRVVRTRHQSAEVYRNWEMSLWLYSLPLAAVALIAYGGFRLAGGGGSYHWLAVGVPLIPVMEMKQRRQFHLNPRELTMSWWYKHMECMLGCGIAFHTAGMVFTSRWLGENLGYQLSGAYQLIPWILPTAIGVPATHLWILHYKLKFGDATGVSRKNVAMGDASISPAPQAAAIEEAP